MLRSIGMVAHPERVTDFPFAVDWWYFLDRLIAGSKKERRSAQQNSLKRE
jgi:hypothetical protein